VSDVRLSGISPHGGSEEKNGPKTKKRSLARTLVMLVEDLLSWGTGGTSEGESDGASRGRRRERMATLTQRCCIRRTRTREKHARTAVYQTVPALAAQS